GPVAACCSSWSAGGRNSPRESPRYGRKSGARERQWPSCRVHRAPAAPRFPLWLSSALHTRTFEVRRSQTRIRLGRNVVAGDLSTIDKSARKACFSPRRKTGTRLGAPPHAGAPRAQSV